MFFTWLRRLAKQPSRLSGRSSCPSARQRTAARLGVEPLEDRQLLSARAFLDHGVLRVIGTARDDQIYIYTDGPESARLSVQINGGPFQHFKDAEKIVVFAGAGNDTVFINPIFAARPLDALASAAIEEAADRVAIVIHGGSGDDLVGLDGSGTVLGGRGNDTLRGSDGNDYLHGGHGTDVIRGNAGNDRLVGGPGNDRLDGGSGDDLLEGQGGDDHLAGDSGRDTLRGGAGNDTLDGGSRFVWNGVFVPRCGLNYGQSVADGVADVIQGGPGRDTAGSDETAAVLDPLDQLVSVERDRRLAPADDGRVGNLVEVLGTVHLVDRDIGGFETGIILDARFGGAWLLDLGPNQELRARAERLNGRLVTVLGTTHDNCEGQPFETRGPITVIGLRSESE